MTADAAGRASVSLAAKGIHQTLGGTLVLRGVDIEVAAGSTAAIIGPSGSGKSTLLRTLNRLHAPDSGDILLDGRSVLRDDPDELRQRIGMVF
jgi:polar amino acid transport system ATP-binding protein